MIAVATKYTAVPLIELKDSNSTNVLEPRKGDLLSVLLESVISSYTQYIYSYAIFSQINYLIKFFMFSSLFRSVIIVLLLLFIVTNI